MIKLLNTTEHLSNNLRLACKLNTEMPIAKQKLQVNKGKGCTWVPQCKARITCCQEEGGIIEWLIVERLYIASRRHKFSETS